MNYIKKNRVATGKLDVQYAICSVVTSQTANVPEPVGTPRKLGVSCIVNCQGVF